ncbi:CPBP family intramembrane metalloprotease [bacterium]|nr:CPBP family intramembrane metalloprotease [bacterium]
MADPNQYPPTLEHHDHRHALQRVGLIAALLAMAAGLVSYQPHSASTQLPQQPGPDGWLLQGDLRYRLGRALGDLESHLNGRLSVDPEDVVQSGIACYERAALRSESPDARAGLRLAVIYARRGNADEALKLLGKLVQNDEARGDLYLAVSAVYDTRSVDRKALLQAAEVLKGYGGWPSLLAQADLFRRLGVIGQAKSLEAEATSAANDSAGLLLLVGLAYGLLLLVGAALLIRYVLRWLLRPPAPRSTLPWPQVTWSSVDAAELGAVLLCAMALARVTILELSRRVHIAGDGSWAAALPALLSYLFICGLAAAYIGWRMHQGEPEPWEALGVRSAPGILRSLATGLGAYGMMLASLAALALMLGGSWAKMLFGAAMVQDLPSGPQLFVRFAIACVLAPAAEEIIFRGFIYAGLRRSFNPILALPISAAIFGIAHLNLALGGMATVAVMGIMLALVYERTHSLWPGIVAHGLHNLLAFLLLVAAGL